MRCARESRTDGICRVLSPQKHPSVSTYMCKLTDMDEEIDKIISTIRSYPPLWDMKDKRYHSRDIQRKLWAKVTEEVGGDVTELKKKWKGLRDSFRREYKKFLKSGQEAPDEFVSTWPFFEQMLFLSDVMEPRELKGNLSSSANDIPGISNSQTEESMEEHQEHSSAIDTAGNSSQSESESSVSSVQLQEMGPPQSSTKRQRTGSEFEEMTNQKKRENNGKKKSTNKKNLKVQNCDAQFLEIERAKLALFSDSTSMKRDSEYQFLLSLHPYLKKVPEHRQLSVRNKLQQVLIDEQEYHHSIQQPASHASLCTVSIPSPSPSQSSGNSSTDTLLNTDVTPQSWMSEGKKDNQPMSSYWVSQQEQNNQQTFLLSPATVNTAESSQHDGFNATSDLRNYMNFNYSETS